LALRGCRLEAEWAGGKRTAIDIELPGDCVFVTTTSGVQVMKTKQGQAVLVVSSHPDPKIPGDCDTHVRAVVSNGERLAVSSEEQVIAMCGAKGPWDTMMFEILAASARVSK
jgi:hypothetical protein